MLTAQEATHWLGSTLSQPATEETRTSLRSRPLAETERLAEHHLHACGITRIADVTDLDTLGIPVYNSIRPEAAPGLNTVTSGKGTTRTAARVSAMMEAIERTWCEPHRHPAPVTATYEDLRSNGALALDPRRLILRRGHQWTPDVSLSWWPARELRTDTQVYVPALAVFTPFPHEAGMFSSNTIGLASGNDPAEALLHGLLEVVEHDCTAFGEVLRRGSSILLDDLPAPVAEIVAGFRAAKVDIRMYTYANELGIPTVFVTADDRLAEDGLFINGGAGCHPDPVVAALRALTEAAQSRLAVISGSREDLERQAYRRHTSYDDMRTMLASWGAGRPTVPFSAIQSVSSGSVKADVQMVMTNLARAGLDLVLAIELAPVQLPFSITKILVPGCEIAHADAARVGPRLRRELRLRTATAQSLEL